MIRNHSVWEAIFQERICLQYSSVKVALGGWKTCRRRIDYLKRKVQRVNCRTVRRSNGKNPNQSKTTRYDVKFTTISIHTGFV